jgi:hypothetical protein
MGFEETQKGNPHGLTINQHVFPKKSIDRFAGNKGLVQLYRKNGGQVIRVNSSNNLFCALRVWDQHTEAGVGKYIEDRFQSLAESIQTGSTQVIGHFEKKVVEEFFSLWRTRHRFLHQGLEDAKLWGIDGDSLTKDQQEILERKHVMFCVDGVMPGRFLAGPQVFGYSVTFQESNVNTQWGIVRASDGEFIVPDCFEDMMIVPLSPSISLMADQPNTTITRRELEIVNSIAINRSENFFFAKNFSRCPITRTSYLRLPPFQKYDDISRYAAGVIR